MLKIINVSKSYKNKTIGQCIKADIITSFCFIPCEYDDIKSP